MRAENKHVLFCLVIVVLFCLSGCTDGGNSSSTSKGPAASAGPPRESTPQVLTPEASDIEVKANDKAILDFSNASQGYICAKSLVAPTQVKVLVDVSGTQYQYTLSDSDEFVVIPLSNGDGDYAVSLWENVFDDQYASIFSQDLQVQLQDQFLPFLYPNQFVNFNAGNAAIAFAAQLVREAKGEISAIDDIYNFVITNIEYDFDKAATVGSNYLPVIDETLETKKGICFDYAVLTAAMLRSQRIPTKLVIGYAGQAYHSWIEVFSNEEGWIKKEIHFDGKDYVLMDPTFASAGRGQVDVSSIVGDGSNYNPRFLY